MFQVLLIGSDKTVFKELEMVLRDESFIISWSESGQTALDMIQDKGFQIVITDEYLSDMTGIQLIRKLIEINPMINCAAISTLPADEYHEQSEGLGLIMQLPAQPSKEDGQELFKRLNSILILTKSVG
jgi:DNA-binding response OmpR family regulator